MQLDSEADGESLHFVYGGGREIKDQRDFTCRWTRASMTAPAIKSASTSDHVIQPLLVTRFCCCRNDALSLRLLRLFTLFRRMVEMYVNRFRILLRGVIVATNYRAVPF